MYKKCKGFIAITTVLILSAVVAAIAVTVTLLSIDEAQSSLSLYKGEDNIDSVEGCVEDALLKARSDSTFGEPIGTLVNITHPLETCVVRVNSKTGSGIVTWDMDVTTNATGYQRTIKVIFNREPTRITLTSWKEI